MQDLLKTIQEGFRIDTRFKKSTLATMDMPEHVRVKKVRQSIYIRIINWQSKETMDVPLNLFEKCDPEKKKQYKYEEIRVWASTQRRLEWDGSLNEDDFTKWKVKKEREEYWKMLYFCTNDEWLAEHGEVDELDDRSDWKTAQEMLEYYQAKDDRIKIEHVEERFKWQKDFKKVQEDS